MEGRPGGRAGARQGAARRQDHGRRPHPRDRGARGRLGSRRGAEGGRAGRRGGHAGDDAARRPQGPRQLPRRAQQGPPGPRRDIHLLPLQDRRRGAVRLKEKANGEVRSCPGPGHRQLAGHGVQP